MITTSREKVIAGMVTLLFLASFGAALHFFNVKTGAENGLKTEKVKSEKMLSEKLELSKEIEKLKKDIASFKGKNDELDKKLVSLEKLLTQKENQLTSNARFHNLAINDYKKQLADLNGIRGRLNEEIARQNEQLAVLKKENDTLKDAIAMMEASNEDLVTKNYVLSQIVSENYGVEAHKRKDRLTINSKRAKKIQLGFDVPSEMSENLSFIITSPDGKLTSSNNSKTISYAVNSNFDFGDATTTASLSGLVPGSINNKKHVVLSYEPNERLSKGVYRIKIYSDSTFIGSSQIKLK